MRGILIALALALLLVGCVGMTAAQKATYLDMVAAGEDTCSYPTPVIAGVLSILPGGGQFYNGQVGLGILNALFWPLSYFWSIPSAISDANTIRKIRSVECYEARKREEKYKEK